MSSHRCRSPEASLWVGVDRVQDVDTIDRMRRIGSDRQAWNPFQAQPRHRRVREAKRPLQVLVDPQRTGDGKLGREPVIQVYGEGVTDLGRGNQPAGAEGVVHNAVEVVGGSQPEQGGLDVRRVRLKPQRGTKQPDVSPGNARPLLRKQRPPHRAEPLPAG